MTVTDWLDSLRLRFHHATAQKPRRRRPRRRLYAAGERLEDRTLLAVNVTDLSAFVVEITGGESVSIDNDGDYVRVNVNGTPTTYNSIRCDNVTSLYVYGDSDAGDGNTINLSGVTTAAGFSGLDGNVTIDGGGGTDSIIGSEFADWIVGSTENDTLSGGAGNDTMNGQGGVDTVLGDEGNDSLKGSAGGDSLDGGPGADVLEGGGGDDLLVGGAGDDSLDGEAGDDTLSGGDDNDLLEGGEDDDSIDGGAGQDVLYGEVGNDTLVGGTENDTLYGGDDNDNLNGQGHHDVVYGGDGDDTLNGSAGNDLLDGEAGQDTLEGGGGDDTLNGGEDNDSLDGGDGNDSIDGEGGEDVLNGDEGNDTLLGGTENDTLYGGDDNDNLNGQGHHDVVYGGNGDDTLNGSAGNDLLDGESGQDVLDGGGGDDTLTGGDGADSLAAGTGNDSLLGGDGDDTLLGETGDDTLDGEVGDDVIDGGDDTDTYTDTGLDDTSAPVGVEVTINQPPAFASVTATPSVLDEGSWATVSGTVNDDGPVLCVYIDWKDGGEEHTYLASGSAFSFSHFYADDTPAGTPSDIFNVTLVADEGSAEGYATAMILPITVNNVDPALTMTTPPPPSAFTGETVSVAGTQFDPGCPEAWSIEINWGDGTIDFWDEVIYPGNYPFSFDHAYSTADDYTITLSALDDDNGSAVLQYPVTIEPNSPPIAVADTYIVAVDGVLSVADADGWLANDSDPGGDTLTVVFVDDTSLAGSLSWSATGAFNYTPPSGFAGTETFTYAVSDGELQSNLATVSIAVGDLASIGSVGVAWEGNDIDFYLNALTAAGTIVSYEVDIDGDGTYDINSSTHMPDIDGTLLDDVPLAGLLGSPPGDNGTYTATLRIANDLGQSAVFAFPISIGNVPPDVELSGPVGGVDPGQTYLMSVTTSDPGPDTITSLEIDWGDGIVNTFPAASGNFSHVYSTADVYTIVVTATDEDGANSAEYEISIGDNTPLPPTDETPQVTSSSATITGTGEAELTVTAEDESGNPVVSYEWDLTGDGNFGDATGPTVLLSPGPDFFPYVACLRVTDGAGRTSEALFAFADPADAQPKATKNTYRTRFKETTPAVADLIGTGPDDCQIHHTKQEADVLAARYLKEQGVNVHENDYLRAAPRVVHNETSEAQRMFWVKKAEELTEATPGGPTITPTQAKQLVPLAEVDAFNAQLQAQYSQYWVEAGASADDVRAIKNKMKAPAKFTAGKQARLTNLGFAFTGIALLDLFAKNSKAALDIRDHTPAQMTAWHQLEMQYNITWRKAFQDGYIKNDRADHLKNAFVGYWRSLGIDQNTVSFMDVQMTKWIEHNIPN